MSQGDSGTLFQRVGGEDAVQKLLVAFYERVLADDELRGFFEQTPIEKLQHMQHEFFCAALDGPIEYSGRSISEVHVNMDIQPFHLARFLEHLVDTLRQLRIDEDDIYDIYSRINTYADEITGETNVDG